MADSYEYDNESSGSIKNSKILNDLSNCEAVKITLLDLVSDLLL
jgi:hypothetical protein